MTNLQALKPLGYLFRIVEAGEKGYAVAAANVNNRGLKLILKSLAQQRANFKVEIFAEMQRLGSKTWPRSSVRGMLHRGRIDIFAALTIGDENRERVVLKEVMVGERVALKAYARTLKAKLPYETRDIVAAQFEQVKKDVDQIQSMLGRAGKRLVVRLYDNNTDATRAIHALTRADYPGAQIEKVSVDMLSGSRRALQLYKGRGTTIFETILSGATGGALWGAVNGALAAFGILSLSGFGPESLGALTLEQFAGLAALNCIAGGAFVGGMIGGFIGWGITSGDEYVSDQAVEQGRILVRVLTEERRASQAWRLLAQVNRESRLRASEAPA
jgi:uncharacterized protein (TIGR02284 family)